MGRHSDVGGLCRCIGRSAAPAASIASADVAHQSYSSRGRYCNRDHHPQRSHRRDHGNAFEGRTLRSGLGGVRESLAWSAHLDKVTYGSCLLAARGVLERRLSLRLAVVYSASYGRLKRVPFSPFPLSELS